MKVKLGDIVQIVNGSTPSTEIENFWDGDIVWLTPKDLSDQQSKYVYRGARNISEIGFKKNGLTMLPVDSVLLTSRAPIGLLAINKVECCTNQGFKSLIPNKEKVDFEYLYYFLVLHKKDIERIGSGTTFKEVSKTYLSQFELSLPILSEQREISRCLSTIDKKIDINTQINTELESLAKTIYDYWFLQFDFPNKEGKPYKSSGGTMVWNEDLKMEIPEGWEVTTLGKIIVEQPKSKIPVEDAKTAQGNIPFFTSGNSILKWDKPLVSGRNCYVNDGGNADVRYYIGETAYSTHTWCITGKNGTSDFLYLTLVTLKPELDIKYFQGSTLKNLNKSALKKRPFFIPPADVMTSFNKIIQPIFDMISENIRQNQELTNLRDFLLPLLMNGQVGFKDA